MRVAITGARGQLGTALADQLGEQAIVLGRDDLDLTDSLASHKLIDLRPAAVINCGAYTSVDQAEKEPDSCHAVNAEAVAILAEVCRQLAIPLVQISTDYVFGAREIPGAPYCETDAPEPQGVYARSKLAGEDYARGWQKHCIVRTCGLYGNALRTRNFVDTMLRLAKEGRPIRVVDDQRCTPSYAPDVARAILFLLRRQACGTYHVVNAGETTWHDFAVEIFRRSGIDVQVERISSRQYGGAPRPRYSVLSTEKYRALGGPPLRPWQEALMDYLAHRE